RGPLLFADRAESLAAAAFYPSPFDHAAILVSGGEGATTSLARGEGRRIEILRESPFPHSLGTLIAAVRESCGFPPGCDDRVLLDLAPMGEARHVETIRDRVLDLREDGSFRLDPGAFDFLSRRRAGSRGFEALFGPPRASGTPVTAREMDLARSLQEVLGEALLRAARHLHERTGEEDLVLAGDAAVLAASSGRLLREGPFRRVWVPPVPEDCGAALGAALCAWHGFLEKERSPGTGCPADAFLGPGFGEEETAAVLTRAGARARRPSAEEFSRAVARLLAEGQIVGWFQGRMELGSRALGNRSILADARRAEARSRIHREVEYGEPFRLPSACVLAEDASEYFESAPDGTAGLVAAPVRASRGAVGAAPGRASEPSLLPAVTHVDGSAYPQVVRRESNPLLHRLLEAFRDRTGCGVLLQASLRLPGEPLVRTPLEAYRCFLRTGMDALAVGPFLLEKRDQRSLLDDPDWASRFEAVA
ncbi:MAG TPA: carbamoyltransferase C-terminal domain-containing protein, partial [Planctomycetota bacterium]|nr:carbamoyltransferase C-terminal domain-containing protein [Planctomycetota bacterium]